MTKQMSLEFETFKPTLQKSNSIGGEKHLIMRQSSRNNVYQPVGGMEKYSTEDQQVNNLNQNFNVTEQKSMFSPQMINSQVISEDPQYNNKSHSPARPSNNLEKRIQKFDEMIDQLK